MIRARSFLFCALVCAIAGPANAADLGIRASNLIIIDEPTRTSVKFTAHKDTGIQKGPAGSISDLDGTFEIFYTEDPANFSRLLLPRGDNWRLNYPESLRYEGPLVEKLQLINNKAVKLKAVSLGDSDYYKLHLETGGIPSESGGIVTILTITNSGDGSVHRMCTRFSVTDGSMVSVRATRKGGHKLVARRGVPVSCERGATFRMEPGLERGFFGAPWPNDTRLRDDGSLNMDGFPAGDSGLVQRIIDRGAEVTKAFGTNSAVFFQTGNSIDTATLPTAENSVLPGSTVMLVNLDDPSEARTPVLLNVKTNLGRLRPPDLLSILPYPGHGLHGQTRYAAILFSGIQTSEGTPYSPAPLLAALDSPWDASKPLDATRWAALKTQRDDVYDYVDNHTSWATSDVVALTVYTTQDVTGEMMAVAAAINAMPQPTPLNRTTGNCSGGVKRTTVTGQLALPHFQSGNYPYVDVDDGGEITVSGGVAVQQSTETVNLSMTFPCGPAPVNGWPILLFMSGTGGGANSANISYIGGNSSSNPLPYIVASIAPLYSGDRYVSGLNPPYNESEFLFFNYVNGLAGRTNQIQQAGEMMYLRRVVEGIQLSAAETGNAAPVQTDNSLEVIAGHSQGSLTMPLTLAADPSFDAAFLSAGGAGLYQTVLHRLEVRIPLGVVIGPGTIELDQFHPMVHLVQTFVEIGDSANYGPFVTTPHVVSTSGLIDGCSPVEALSILGTSMGLDVANPLFYPVFGSASLETPTTTLPANGNLGGGRTGVTIQLQAGHFGSATNPNIGRSFLDSVASGGATVNPGMLLSDDEPHCFRYDQLGS